MESVEIDPKLRVALSGKRCLVLGAFGFLGSHLVRQLNKAGARVTAYGHQVRNCGWSAHVEVCEGRFEQSESYERLLHRSDVVFHLVSSNVPASAQLNVERDLIANLIPSVKLLDLCARNEVGRVVFVSSGGTVYGRSNSTPIREDGATDPIGAYGITKLAIEKYVQMYEELHDLQYCILRVANPYGPGQLANRHQGAIGVFLDRAIRRESIEVWGDGRIVRDYVYVLDVVDALMRGAAFGPNTKINIGTGVGHSLNEVLALIEGAIGEVVRRLDRPARSIDIPTNVLDVELAARTLGWVPRVNLTEGIQRTLAWHRSIACDDPEFRMVVGN